MNSNIKVGALSAALAAILFASIFIVFGVFADVTAVRGRFDPSLVAYFPSVFRAALLAYGFWSFIGMAVGSAVFGYSLGAALLGEEKGPESGAVGRTIAGIAVGFILAVASFAGPAYRVQAHTHITKSVNETPARDRDFKIANQPDSLYLDAFTNK